MHHSFDDRPSASSEDLFASCNDIDNAVSLNLVPSFSVIKSGVIAFHFLYHSLLLYTRHQKSFNK